LRAHALKKPLRVLDIWALGVGVVVAGAYFGWNLGLKQAKVCGFEASEYSWRRVRIASDPLTYSGMCDHL
jgi:hypothetical protein